MRLAPILVAAGVLSAGPLAVADPPAPVICEKLPGMLAGPYVPDPETAQAVFLALESRIFPGRNIAAFPRVMVTDAGGSWTVFRTAAEPAISDPVALPEGGSVVSMRGGNGQLEMRIDKCSGAISAHFSR